MTKIRSMITNEKYRENYDRIFGKKPAEPTADVVDSSDKEGDGVGGEGREGASEVDSCDSGRCPSCYADEGHFSTCSTYAGGSKEPSL